MLLASLTNLQEWARLEAEGKALEQREAKASGKAITTDPKDFLETLSPEERAEYEKYNQPK